LAVQQANNEEFKTSMYTMIKQASKKGYLIVLEALVTKVKEAGIDVKTFLSSGLETPLHYAAAGGKLKVIQFLLDQGIDINIVCGSGTVYFISEKCSFNWIFLQLGRPSIVQLERTNWNVWNSSWIMEH